jgi:hypothetical protein
MRFSTALVAARAGYVLATFFFSPLISYADSAPMSAAEVTRNDTTLNNQDVAPPAPESYRTESPHRLSRGCGFHFDNLRHGLGC